MWEWGISTGSLPRPPEPLQLKAVWGKMPMPCVSMRRQYKSLFSVWKAPVGMGTQSDVFLMESAGVLCGDNKVACVFAQKSPCVNRGAIGRIFDA